MHKNSTLFQWEQFVPCLKHGQHHALLEHIAQLRNEGNVIYPEQNLIFNALSFCPPQKISVIILGQDPYHGSGQAHGLAFSVPKTSPIPPSLRNIFNEINSDIYQSQKQFYHGDLSNWAKQGVLLLNTILTVNDSKPLSHAKLGWQTITYNILQSLAQGPTPLAVLLWGKHAQSYQTLFKSQHHLVLSTSHPSPLSAHRGFLGCKHFSKTNNWLTLNHKHSITW